MKSIQLTQEEILHILMALASRDTVIKHINLNHPKDKILKEEKLAHDILNKLLGK